jgi:hypothetical protein
MNVEELLDEVEAEWQKFSKSDEVRLRKMIDELVKIGEYKPTPLIKSGKITYFGMVQGYGARWHRWPEPTDCPCCGYDLRDYESGPPFMRGIAIYSRAKDRTLHYKCPKCKEAIPR